MTSTCVGCQSSIFGRRWLRCAVKRFSIFINGVYWQSIGIQFNRFWTIWRILENLTELGQSDEFWTIWRICLGFGWFLITFHHFHPSTRHFHHMDLPFSIVWCSQSAQLGNNVQPPASWNEKGRKQVLSHIRNAMRIISGKRRVYFCS